MIDQFIFLLPTLKIHNKYHQVRVNIGELSMLFMFHRLIVLNYCVVFFAMCISYSF